VNRKQRQRRRGEHARLVEELHSCLDAAYTLSGLTRTEVAKRARRSLASVSRSFSHAEGLNARAVAVLLKACGFRLSVKIEPL